jgi:hypothetical protein
LNRQAPCRFDLSVCVQRAALKTPTPFGRTLSFPASAIAPLTRYGLLPPGKLWAPSADPVQSPREWVARHTLRASMYRRQRHKPEENGA